LGKEVLVDPKIVSPRKEYELRGEATALRPFLASAAALENLNCYNGPRSL